MGAVPKYLRTALPLIASARAALLIRGESNPFAWHPPWSPACPGVSGSQAGLTDPQSRDLAGQAAGCPHIWCFGLSTAVLQKSMCDTPTWSLGSGVAPLDGSTEPDFGTNEPPACGGPAPPGPRTRTQLGGPSRPDRHTGHAAASTVLPHCLVAK